MNRITPLIHQREDKALDSEAERWFDWEFSPVAMNSSPAHRRSPLGLFPGQPEPRLYDRVVEILRTRHYSRRTEEAYLHWIRRFLLFHGRAHPRQLAEGDVKSFPTHLAFQENWPRPLRIRPWRRCCSCTSMCWANP